MARVVRLPYGRPLKVGEANITARKGKNGRLELVIEAPRHMPIELYPADRGQVVATADPSQLTLGQLPELVAPTPPADSPPF